MSFLSSHPNKIQMKSIGIATYNYNSSVALYIMDMYMYHKHCFSGVGHLMVALVSVGNHSLILYYMVSAFC